MRIDITTQVCILIGKPAAPVPARAVGLAARLIGRWVCDWLCGRHVRLPADTVVQLPRGVRIVTRGGYIEHPGLLALVEWCERNGPVPMLMGGPPGIPLLLLMLPPRGR